MAFRDLKYLLAYLIPFICILSLQQRGGMSWAVVGFVFVLIPLVEPFWGKSTHNLDDPQKQRMLSNPLFDYLLYFNLPIVYGTLIYFLTVLNTSPLNNIEYTGLIISVGIVLGACGINVAHELGHRSDARNQFLAKLLLLPSWYMHFFIEHNRGHHKNIATELDPASARKNESLYTFWWRSVIQSYVHAWELEANRLRKEGRGFWTYHNEMIGFSLVQCFYLLIIILLSNHWYSILAIILAGVVGFLLLETINYIEHYGLRRQQLSSGHYERVSPKHSWNADYQLGRILLYELTRHSDHHFLASKKYQVLDHRAEAPELPFGYPTAMLIALVPPLWFSIMNKRLPGKQANRAYVPVRAGKYKPQNRPTEP